MKKVLMVLLIAFTAFQASGQETFGVAYPDKLSEFDRGLLEVLNVAYMKADFSGNLKNKRIHIEEVVCRDGEFSTNVITPEWYILTNINRIHMYIKPVSQDSVTVKLFFKGDNGGGEYGNVNIALRNDKYFIGMETGVKALMKDTPDPTQDTVYYPLGMDIPVMAYTTGIKVENEVFNGVDYCGLRDAMVHPREWYAKFGIKNYVYYTVRFE